MLLALKVNGVCYQCILDYQYKIVYKEEITEQKYKKLGGI